MSRVITRYSSKELCDLNNGEKYGPHHPITKLFRNFPRVKTHYAYGNQYNDNFYVGGIKKLKIANAASNNRVIEDIRMIISTVSKTNCELQIDKFNSTRISDKERNIPVIAKEFHIAMIDCIFLVKEYLKMLYRMKNEGIEVEIQNLFTRKVITQHLHPTQFADNDLELGTRKTQRWIESNITIIGEIYANRYGEPDSLTSKCFNTEVIYNKVLLPVFKDIDDSDGKGDPNIARYISLLCTIWQLTRDRLSEEEPEKCDALYKRIVAMSESTKFPPTVRAKLFGIIED